VKRTSVLGTPIEDANDDDRARTVLVSDLHVPLAGGEVLAMLERLLQLEREPARTRLLVLGDLFDAFIGHKQLTVGACRDVVSLFADATRAGMSVTVLHGNRDFMLDGAFTRACGARVVAGGLRLGLGGQRALALHGDELCLRDLPYQRSKRWLRHRLTRAVLRNLPLAAALWCARRVRAASQASGARAEPARYAPTAAALEAVFAEPLDLLVFGHIHRPARGAWPGAGEYCILPAFDATGVHLVYDDGELSYRDVGGARVADYPARTFD
jgi:UDP-2,3-diacylglucosamine hydrolase